MLLVGLLFVAIVFVVADSSIGKNVVNYYNGMFKDRTVNFLDGITLMPLTQAEIDEFRSFLISTSKKEKNNTDDVVVDN